MPFAEDKIAGNAMGGTEIMKLAIEKRLPKELLDNFQIFVSRVHEPLSDKHIRILWCQDLPGDPASDHLKNGGWKKFHRIIFATHWQMRGFMEFYDIPWSKCVVIRNGIEPIEFKEKSRDKIKLIYSSTPHRGLNILYSVFNKLAEEDKDVELDVFSSFKLYGWDERDTPYAELFEKLKEHPQINYHGSVSNEEVRAALQESHILAYPSTWQETSCLCLMEAISAGNMAIHPNYGALFETAANWTYMYQWNEDPNWHASVFYSILRGVIEEVRNMPEDQYHGKLMAQKSYFDVFHNVNLLANQWQALLTSMLNEDRSLPGETFSYKTTP